MKLYRFNYIFGLFKFLILIANFISFSLLDILMKITCFNNIFPFIYNFIISIYYYLCLLLLGIYNIQYKFKKHLKNRKPNIILSSQSSFIDWLILAINYSPKFLYIAKSKDNKNDAYIELSFFSVFFYGIGIKFPKFNKKNKYFDLINYLNK